MKKALSLSLKIFGGLAVFILVAAISVPFLFKDKIKQKVLDEVNNQLTAKVQIGDFGLSLFKSFPDFSLSLENVKIVGTGDFAGDTLINAPYLFVKLDLMSVIKGEKYQIKAIELKDPRMKFKILKDGRANWDITKPSIDTVTKQPTEPKSSFKMGLQKVELKNAYMVYDDESIPFSMEIAGMNHVLKGDMTDDFTTLDTKTTMKQFSCTFDGVKYLNNADVQYDALIDADLGKFKFTFKENELRLNNLFLGFDGYFAMPEDDMDMDIKFNAKKSDFKNFLSLVPGIYSKDFETIKTSGKMELNGYVKGIYNDTKMPAYELNLGVENAMFQYPDLPQAVKNINLKTRISSKDGQPDNTVINVSKFHFEMAGNPIDILLNVTTPVSDPNIEGAIKGKLDLATVKQVYPLEEGQDLNGIFTADLSMKGKMSQIEQEKYEEFKAQGSLLLSNMNYKAKDLKQQVLVKEMKMNFTPQFVSLDNLDAKVGKSDFKANGRVDNLLAYMFRDELLKGTFNLNSSLIDINEFMTDEAAPAATPAAKDTTPLEVVRIPANIDFVMTSKIGKLIYDNMEMTNVDGVVTIRDEKAEMNQLKMNMLQGAMLLSGYYDSKPVQPIVDFTFDIAGFDVSQTFKTFNTIQKLAPFVEKCGGKFSTKLKMKSTLDKNMMPVMNSIDAGGLLKTAALSIENASVFNKFADQVKMSKFKKFVAENLNLSFKMKDGRITVDPFDLNVGNIKGKMQGYSALDKSLNYTMDLKIPTSELGSTGTQFANSLISKANSKTGGNMSLGKEVNLGVIISGLITDPQVKTDLKDQMNDAMDELKNKAKEEADRLKKEAEAKAKAEMDKVKQQAQQEADRLKKEAQDKANKEAEAAKQAAEAAKRKAEEEAKKKAQNELDKLKNKNPFKK